MSSLRPASRLLILLLALGLATAASAAAAPEPKQPEREAPALVLVLVIDQLRPDRLSAELPGGLGQLAREGRVYTEASLDHAITETCPGHAVVLTGRHPGSLGVPGNSFFVESEDAVVYCVEDPTPEHAVIGGIGDGRSPHRLRHGALGDWLRAARPASRVYSVSGKDRAAIMLGGQRPHAAWWLEGGSQPRFTTSLYYLDGLPAWLDDWNGPDPLAPRFLQQVPATWVHERGAPLAAASRPDDFAGETARLERTDPHPLRGADAAETFERVRYSPWLDLLTIDFARELVREERLGQRGATDLLAIGLSATDLVGHLYGPYSHESRDALARLDAALADFLAELEGIVGADRVLTVLTSDHGVLPLPEWLAATDRERCPVPGGRVDAGRFGLRLLAHLHLRESLFSRPRQWLYFAGSQVAVKRGLARERGRSVAQVAARAEAWLESQEAVAEAWTREEILSGRSRTARLYRNSFDPERSGDLTIEVAPGCLITRYHAGTTHGTPHAYDREIPLLFHGAGITPARVEEPVHSIDIAPTLATRLGLALPEGLDGRVLELGPTEEAASDVAR